MKFVEKFKKVDRRDRFLIVFSVIAAIASLLMTAPFLVNRSFADQYVNYGYLGVGFVNFISDVAPFSPVPASLVTFAAASNASFSAPILILISAFATTMGQAFQYLFGDGIDKLVNDYKWHSKLKELFFKSPFIFLVIWIALPNPVKSLGQIFVGTAEYPFWKYLIAAMIGNTIWFYLVVVLGDWFFTLVSFT